MEKELLDALKIAHEFMMKYQDLLGSEPLTEEEHAAFFTVESVIRKADPIKYPKEDARMVENLKWLGLRKEEG